MAFSHPSVSIVQFTVQMSKLNRQILFTPLSILAAKAPSKAQEEEISKKLSLSLLL